MTQDTSPKPIKRILTILSGLAFAASSVFGMVELFTHASQESKANPTSAVASKDGQLKQQVKGYELVLQREPENQVALQGLVQARLQMNDLQGAVEPMEKLVKLNPNNPQYTALLAGIKQRIGKDQ
jgi:cytochrome c-type biogenesis protein CcmH/NrfG